MAGIVGPDGKADDLRLLWGATRIAQTIGVTRRRAFHLLENGLIPGRKVGGWVAEEDALRRFFGEGAFSAEGAPAHPGRSQGGA